MDLSWANFGAYVNKLNCVCVFVGGENMKQSLFKNIILGEYKGMRLIKLYCYILACINI